MGNTMSKRERISAVAVSSLALIAISCGRSETTALDPATSETGLGASVAASSPFCLDEIPTNPEKLEGADLRKLYLHYSVCLNDSVEAGRILEIGAARGEVESIYELALQRGYNDSAEDDREAVALMRRAAAMGHEPAQAAMGRWQATGAF